MENYIHNIELINKYLNKLLSENEVRDFENLLSTDPNFKTLFEEHIVFLEGLKRQSLKAEIKKGKQSYIRNKWFRYFGLTSVIVVLLTIIFINLINSDKEYLKRKLNFESEYTQSFKVKADSIIEIKGEKGTIIRFAPADLQTISKESFSVDSLLVELIELTSKQDLLLANTQTVSNGKWLVSGGAFKIAIKSKGESLVLKETKTIIVKFPKSTQEKNMEIFYGKRDKEKNMNWGTTGIKLKERVSPFVIFIEETGITDIELAKRYGVHTFKEFNVIDSLGHLELEKVFPRINYFDEKADTIRIYKKAIGLAQRGQSYSKDYYEFIEVETLAILENKKEIMIDSILIDLEDLIYGEGYTAFANIYKQISKEELNKIGGLLSKEEFNELKKNEESHFEEVDFKFETLDKVYKTVELSKLGWINIDKFANDETKINIKFKFNIGTSHNEIYVVDQKNNTVLNVSNNEIGLPIDRSFYIISIGIKGKDIYAFKKSVRFNKSVDFKIEYKKVNEEQLKSILMI